VCWRLVESGTAARRRPAWCHRPHRDGGGVRGVPSASAQSPSPVSSTRREEAAGVRAVCPAWRGGAGHPPSWSPRSEASCIMRPALGHYRSRAWRAGPS